MLEFTNLERTVLNVICDEHQEIAGQLRQLFGTARLSERDNTGHGFYTWFDTDKTMPPLDWPQRLVRGPNAEVSVGGETLLMGFILWLEGGYPNCLEGFQYCTPSGDDIDLKATGLEHIAWLKPMS